MKELNNYTIQELSKKIANTNIMPSGSGISFVKLVEQLILQFQNRADLEKFFRIIGSKLISSYGLDITKVGSIEIAEDAYFWYLE